VLGAGAVSLLPALDGLALFVAVLLAALVALVLRRRFLTRSGGTFDCSLRLRSGSHGKGWALGICRYAGDALEWYRVFSYSARPKRVMARQSLQIVDRREPRGPESYALLAGAVIVSCRAGADSVEVAMSQGALTGFLSWLESAPPGAQRQS
jgi:Protein of unknown function (DUF2550)